MTSIVYTKSFDAPELDMQEMLIYAGVRGKSCEVESLLKDCISDVDGVISYKACYTVFPCADISALFKNGADVLLDKLSGCEYVLTFAATVGMEMDRMIKRAGSLSQTLGLLMQAIGTERVESLCDAFEDEVRARCARCGVVSFPRFSPGYGKLPLEMQKDIFALLSPSRHIGVSLGESLLMTPSKSVTAFIGLSGNIEKSRAPLDKWRIV